MSDGRSKRYADWLSLGTETAPMRNGATQEAEKERAERLLLISQSHWPSANLRVMLGVHWRRRSRPR
jgi:hypothetical protein